MTSQMVLPFVRRWLPLLIALPILAGVAAYIVLRQLPSMYEATTTLMVQPAQAGAAVGAEEMVAAQDLAQTYAEAIHTRGVLSAAAARVGLGDVPEAELEARISARRVSNTQLVRISADDRDPAQAAALANAVAQVFLAQNADLQSARFATSTDNLSNLVDQLRGNMDGLANQVAGLNAQPGSPDRDAQLAQAQANLAQAQASYADTVRSYEALRVSAAQSTDTASVLDAAVAPETPLRPSRWVILGVSALAGLAIAIAIALLVEYLTDRLRDPLRVASVTGLPTVGMLPTGRSSTNLRDPADAELAAAHRLMRARLFAAGVQPKCSLLVTSAERYEGKSSVAANLASVLPEADYRVILLDANFHHPTLAQLFEVPNQPGFSTLLADAGATVDSALHTTWHEKLLVVPAGPAPSQASALLSAPRLEAVLRALLDRCDVLIVDTPPVLDMPDAALLSQQVDGVLFVIDAQRSRGRRAVAAIDLLRSLNAEPLGAVLNRVDRRVREFVSHAGPIGTPPLDTGVDVEPEIDEHGVKVPASLHSASSSDNSTATR